MRRKINEAAAASGCHLETIRYYERVGLVPRHASADPAMPHQPHLPGHGKDALRIFLIRHGQTEWSQSGRHTGRSEIPLTAAGEQMARALAPTLAQVAFSHVLTSPRQRARDTCTLAGLGALAQVEPDLAEWDYGDDEGRRSVEILAERPGWNIWTDGCLGGESPAQVSARADRLVQRLRALSGNVAVFGHGHFGRALAVRWVGLPLTAGASLLLDPATVSMLGIDSAHGAIPVIERWNAPG